MDAYIKLQKNTKILLSVDRTRDNIYDLEVDTPKIKVYNYI